MKRLQLFEFEDFSWFPSWIRERMTLYIAAFHRVLRTSDVLTPLLARALATSPEPRILDLCSGGGGPLPDVARRLREEHGYASLEVTLSDLYPNHAAADAIEARGEPWLHYERRSVDATAVAADRRGVRTMICSMHHMRPDVARKILADAHAKRQPLCIFELSDNGPPVFLWWLGIPFAFLTVLVLTPLVRPLTWQQLVFTYLIPILPLAIAWDGAASNARTYTVSDMRELLQGLDASDYRWEVGTLKKPRYPSGMAYVLGLPQKAAQGVQSPGQP